MNLTCDTVLDLVSIYKDGAASDSTAAAIEEHLKRCSDCRRYYRQYDSINRIVTKKYSDSAGEPDNDFERLSSAIRHRRTIETAVLAGCAAITLTAVVCAIVLWNKE